MAVAAKWQRFRRICRFCDKPFGCWRKTQKFRSQKCHALSRPDHQRAAGRLGAAATSQLRIAAVIAEIRAAVPGLTDEAIRLLLVQRRRWWNQGYHTGMKAGRRSGWAEACGERKRRAA
jgi:hypothetical protein